MGVSYPAAKASVHEAAKLGILQEDKDPSAKRPKIFIATSIIGIYDI